MILSVFLIVCVLFALAYRYYGAFLESRLGLNDQEPTPAHRLRDDVDYVPTSPVVLFGHHFSSIAGAGPIVGPIIAGMAFGWGPVVLWIIFGAIFVGGVHDYAAMAVSLRHDGRSVAQICRSIFSPFTYYLLLTFILFTLVYVIIVFLDLTASSFAPVLKPEIAMSDAGRQQILEGGVVTTASFFYIALALLFGSALRFRWLTVRQGSIIFVPLVFLGLFLGYQAPILSDYVPAFMGSAKNTWALALVLYSFLASILPVWLLLQPRDYLSSFLLYACLGAGALGVLVAGFTGQAVTVYPAFLTLHDPQIGWLFPALFVTVACGAVSGFHSIVASGTTVKQLALEKSARPVGYGGMLVEGVLAILAVAAVMVLPEKSTANPVQIFSQGIGTFLSSLGVTQTVAVTFGMLAVSTFLLTTLDTCARLARFMVQELTGLGNSLISRSLTTLSVLVVPAVVVCQEIKGPGGVLMPAWKAVWPAFGASNQLLAALALLVVFAWMHRQGRRAWYIAIPTVFMCVTTLTALAQLIYLNLISGGSLFLGLLSLVLALLALAVIANVLYLLWKGPSTAAAQPGR